MSNQYQKTPVPRPDIALLGKNPSTLAGAILVPEPPFLHSPAQGT